MFIVFRVVLGMNQFSKANKNYASLYSSIQKLT